MRLSASHHFRSPGKRGLQKFGKALLDELRDGFNVRMVSEEEKSDIHLTIISGQRKKGATNVLRIDGVYYDVRRISMNNPIKRSIESFDGVVFQSNWCRTFVTTMLKTRPKSSAVVYNGVDQEKLLGKAAPKKFEKAFVCCAYWRVNKRLESIVHSVLDVRQKIGIDLGLYVVGKPDYEHSSKYVEYVGNVDRVAPYYAAADYMCHICHIDACPNAVVEGLSVGLPVVCNNIGGTPEIVKDSGVIVDIDRPFDFRYIKTMAAVGPKSVDQRKLTAGMMEAMSRKWDIKRPDLDISVAAKGYYDYFCSLLRK